MNPGMSGQFSLFSCRSDCWPPSYISGPQTHTLLGLQGAIHQRKYVRWFAGREPSTITQVIQTSSSNYRCRDNSDGRNWQGRACPPGGVSLCAGELEQPTDPPLKPNMQNYRPQILAFQKLVISVGIANPPQKLIMRDYMFQNL